MAALAIRNVRKPFGELCAVDGLSLEIERGEVLGFLGPNGVAKTTPIGMAVGLPAFGVAAFALGAAIFRRTERG